MVHGTGRDYLKTVNFEVVAGDKKYVKLSHAFGFRVYAGRVNAVTGEAEVIRPQLYVSEVRSFV
jgi:hypothetical protein